MTTETVEDLIAISLAEHRTIAQYPATRAERDYLLEGLIEASKGEVRTDDTSGEGYSGPESRGFTSVWSDDGWSVDIVNPRA